MTPRMFECLQFLEEYIGQKGISPTYDEISAHFNGMSKSGVSRLVHGLAERGKINVLGNRARSISLVKQCKCPNCGSLWNADLITTGNLRTIPTESANGNVQDAAKL